MEQEILLEQEGLETIEELNQENFEIVSDVDIDVNKVDNVATVSIKRWDGSTKSVDIYDGERGPEGPEGPEGRDGVDGKDGADGRDATINGENILSIVAGENITIDQEGSILTISVEEGTVDYKDLENKPTINNVELSGNKSSSDLGLQPAGNYLTEETDPIFSASASAGITSEDITNWNNKSDFSGDYNDLENKPTIPVVPTNVSAFTNDAGYTTNIGTITSVKMNGSTISSSGEADLGTVITDISGKQDTLVSGTNIKTINSESILGSGNIDISGGSSTDVQINGTSIVSDNVANIITNTAYNSSTNKIATMSDINNAITVALTTSY